MSTIKVRPSSAEGSIPLKVLQNSDAEYLPAYSQGEVVASNSSTTPLNDTQVFTGDWIDVEQYDSIVVAIATDQNGTYSVQYSPDATNTDSTLTRYYRTGQINPPHRFTNTRKYARIVFTNNSGSNQTYFRLQTTIGNRQPLNTPLDGTVSRDYDAICTRPTDWHAEVALGRRQGASLWNKFGYNNDVDIGTEVLASWGGAFTPSATASTLTIVSGDAADDSGSTGCNSIVIYGVDENWDEQIEVVTMDGVTPVVTTTQWIGINRVAMNLCGSGLVNAGAITITKTTGGATMAVMPAGEGVTQQLIFYVPQSSIFLAEWVWINTLKQAAQNPVVTINVWVFSAVNNGKQLVASLKIDTAVSNIGELSPPEPFPVGEKSIVWVEVTTDQNDTIINGRLTGVLSLDPDA